MEKFIEDWRRYLVEFKMDDKYGDIDSIVDTNIDVQSAIQAEIDKQMKLNVGGRPINPIFLSNSLNEQTIKEFLENSSDYTEGKEILDGLVEMPVTVHLGPDFDMLRQIEMGRRIRSRTMRMIMQRKADYVENYNDLVSTISNNIKVLKDFYKWIVNSDYLKIIKALALYTGHNVASIRDPSKFDDSARIKSIFEKDYFMIQSYEDYSTKSSFDAASLNPNYRKIRELLSSYDKIFSDDKENLETIASLKNYKRYIQSANFRDPKLASELENFRNSEEFKKRYNFYMTFITKWKPILDKLRNFSNIKPSQKEYMVSKKIISALCNAPDNSGKDIFRGMSLDINVIAGLIDISPLELEEYMDSFEHEKVFGTEKQFIFDFGVVSSCTTDYDVAYDFAMPYATRGDTSRHGVMFRFVPKRGVEIGSFSAYPEEDEFITSGRIKVNRVVLRPGRPHSIFDFYCEQV